MLRLTARHADGWNTAWYGAPDERLDDQLGAMDEALAAEGRDPAALTKTAGMLVYDPDGPLPAQDDEDDVWFGGTVDELAGAIDAHASLGIEHLIVLLHPMTEPSLDRLASALARRSGTA
jgi:alkanesulfonate monooxygenase SsuD/methylene tetrahydromethanopterin reductase-like flavin-dependent oxidoreductase (luciferase family)